MKPVRYIVGVIGFLLVWFVVAVVVGLIVAIIFPPPGGRVFTDIGLDWRKFTGIGMDWRNLPGTILGLLAGIQSFRASVRGAKKKDDK